MTAVSQERLLLPQPQSKALPTVQSSHPDIVAVRNLSNSRPPSRARVAKPKQDVPVADFTSNSATLSLIRRTLVKDASQNNESRSTPKPIEGILPPLTSSNEVDLELYALVAIIVKDFINTWYSKITQDRAFVDEVIQIVAHCSRALEQRIRRTDIAELILDELPVLLERHVNAYRTATASLAKQSYGATSQAIYHSLNPHPALEPGPAIAGAKAEPLPTSSQNEAAYRQMLVTGTLAILLPTEDLQNAPLRILVSDVIADLIIGQALAEKICEGWFIHSAIIKAVAVLKEKVEPKASGEALRNQTKNRLDQFGLLTTERESKSTLQSLDESRVAIWFWRIMQWIYFAITALWFVLQGLFDARHLPKRLRAPSSQSGSLKISPTSPITHECDVSPRPVLAYGVSNFVSVLIRLSDRMPWLGSAVMFWQHVLLSGSGQLACTNSVLDRFLYHNLATYVFTPKLVVGVLVSLRSVLFPNNSLGPPAPPAPSFEERAEIRRHAAEAILSIVPKPLAHRYFNSVDDNEILQYIEEDILDVFGDKYMNKHLIYGILELILVRLAPELQEAGVGELLGERGVTWGGVDPDVNVTKREAEDKVEDLLVSSNS